MPALSQPVKRFIVGRLACYYTPQEVVEQVKLEFGLAMVRSHVSFYDPTTANGKALGKELTALFHEARANFDSSVQEIPIAKQSYRLQRLQDLTVKHGKNPALVAQLLEQAAKEVGGMFTNRREITGKDGGPIEHLEADPLHRLRKIREQLGDGAPAGREAVEG